MEQEAVAEYIVSAHQGTEVIEDAIYQFFFFDPEKMFPFATIAKDDHESDCESNLARIGVYRLNIGVSRETFTSLLSADDQVHDFAALDRFMPHPVYGAQHWVSILNPGKDNFERVKPLLREAYERSVARQERRTSRA